MSITLPRDDPRCKAWARRKSPRPPNHPTDTETDVIECEVSEFGFAVPEGFYLCRVEWTETRPVLNRRAK